MQKISPIRANHQVAAEIFTGKMCTGLQGVVDHHRIQQRLSWRPPRPDLFLIVGQGERSFLEFDRRRNSRTFGLYKRFY